MNEKCPKCKGQMISGRIPSPLKCVFLCCVLLLIENLSAELPILNTEQLADLIQLNENRIQAFHVNYILGTSKKLTENGKLIPDFLIECEYIHNINKGSQYLHENWMNQPVGQGFERKYAYDGKIGTELILKQPDDQYRNYGIIKQNIPDVFSNQTIWKPDFLGGYGLLRKDRYTSLSKAIRNARRVEITSDELDKKEIYKVYFVLPGEKIKVKDPTGKMIEIEKEHAYYVWLSSTKNYLPLQIAELVRNKEISSLCKATDFRNVDSKIWLPYHIEWISLNGNGRLIDVDNIKLNNEASVITRLNFPPKTYVKDETKGIGYLVKISEKLKGDDIKKESSTNGISENLFKGINLFIIGCLFLIIVFLSFLLYRKHRTK